MCESPQQVLQLAQTLLRTPSSKAVGLRLLHSIWTYQPRVYPQLHAALQQRAAVASTVCHFSFLSLSGADDFTFASAGRCRSRTLLARPNLLMQEQHGPLQTGEERLAYLGTLRDICASSGTQYGPDFVGPLVAALAPGMPAAESGMRVVSRLCMSVNGWGEGKAGISQPRCCA